MMLPRLPDGIVELKSDVSRVDESNEVVGRIGMRRTGRRPTENCRRQYKHTEKISGVVQFHRCQPPCRFAEEGKSYTGRSPVGKPSPQSS